MTERREEILAEQDRLLSVLKDPPEGMTFMEKRAIERSIENLEHQLMWVNMWGKR